MSKQVVLIIVLFAVAMGSGFVIGTKFQRHEAPQGGGERSFLADQLGLTSAQREQMRAIWQDVAHGGRHGDAWRQVQKDRDEAVVALLTPEQKAAYDKIQEKSQQQMADLNKDRDAAIKKAVEKTKAILDDKQRAKYEEILKRGPGEGRGGGHWGASRPASNPTSEAVKQ